MLRFIHCADLHFDRTFEGLHLLDNEVKNLPRENEKVLSRIVDLAIEQSIDFLLFAGDTFHQNRPSLKTQQLFFQQIKRLEKKQIAVYLSFGNHDYYDSNRYWFEFPENVHLFKEEEVQTIKGQTKTKEKYTISAFSYLHPWITSDKAKEFPKKETDYHIGMYHGEMTSEHYAPFKITELRSKNYDYWALGHIHLPTVLSFEDAIVYSGTAQGHSQKEKKAAVNLVTIENGQTSWKSVDVATVHWQTIQLSLKNIQQQKQVLAKIKDAFTDSEKNLVEISLFDAEQLAQNGLNETDKRELIDYLNHYLKDQDMEQRIFKITNLENQRRQKIRLAHGSQEVAQQLIDIYSQSDVFTEVTQDLQDYPGVHQALDFSVLQQEAIDQLNQQLKADFEWEQIDENT